MRKKGQSDCERSFELNAMDGSDIGKGSRGSKVMRENDETRVTACGGEEGWERAIQGSEVRMIRETRDFTVERETVDDAMGKGDGTSR